MSKPQDGLVSRFLNRPVSHFITSHLLLKLPIHPNAWTMSIFVIPVVAAMFLLRGDYVAIVIGAALFQLYSILDGCDGEIARAKSLESKFGEHLDYFCDVLGSLLFVSCLGFGLNRFREGIICGAVIAANELLLRFGSTPSESESPLNQVLYRRHQGMIEHSGIRFLGDKPIWWLMQLTKRDVAILFFLILALINRAEWILHLWIIVALGSLLGGGAALVRLRTAAREPRA